MHHTLFEERMSIFIGLNAIFQFVGDVVLEALGLIPPRINHLALTFLNAFISFKTLSAIQKDKFKFLHEDCQIFWVLELLLIIGDIYYSFHDDWDPVFIFFRLTFIILSTFNWFFVTWIIIKYKLYHLTYQGSHDEETQNQNKNQNDKNENFFHDNKNQNSSDKDHDNEDLSHAAIEIDELNKKISIAEDEDAANNGTLPVIDEATPALENGHDSDNQDCIEDSLSVKMSKQPSYIASRNEHTGGIISHGHSTISGVYHHTPVPHDGHDHDTPNVKPLKLHPHQPSFTLTQSEVP